MVEILSDLKYLYMEGFFFFLLKRLPFLTTLDELNLIMFSKLKNILKIKARKYLFLSNFSNHSHVALDAQLWVLKGASCGMPQSTPATHRGPQRNQRRPGAGAAGGSISVLHGLMWKKGYSLDCLRFGWKELNCPLFTTSWSQVVESVQGARAKSVKLSEPVSFPWSQNKASARFLQGLRDVFGSKCLNTMSDTL